MYAGRGVEVAPVDDIFYEPRHPYTLGLLASLPRVDTATRGLPLYRIVGEPPSLVDVPPGCEFHPRCPFARVPGICVDERPPLVAVGPAHASACHFRDELHGMKPEQLRAQAATS
jgi:oligopeptide transport system ATP-binding protein